MANYTQGDTRPVLNTTDLATYQGNGSLVLDSRRTRPLWFDGRFLTARDLEREQNYFLARQSDLGHAPGFGVIQGLLVDTVALSGQSSNSDAIIIHAGQGVTPAGELVTIPSDLTLRISDLAEQSKLDAQFGISTIPPSDSATRTGLFVVGLRPVQFSANPITAYPLRIQGLRTLRDGDLVEATAISLVPYPDPSNNSDAATLHAALARQIFLTGNPGQLSDSLLPLAMVSLRAGVVDWLDPWLVRRETGSQFSGLRFGLTDSPTQQAYLQQYDSQLQQAVNTLIQQRLPARFPATNYFQSLPPAGRFPIAALNTDTFAQLFFPPQMDVRLSIVPEDELPNLLADAMSLPPLDLTLSPAALANLTVFALIPVPRDGYSTLAASLPAVASTSILPQVLSNRLPIDLLRFYKGNTGIIPPPANANSAWQSAIGTQTFGYYLRRRSSAPIVIFKTPPPPVTATTTTTTTTTTTAPTTTTTTPPPLALANLTPSSATAGGPTFTVTVNGSGFNSSTTLSWTVLLTPSAAGAAKLATTFVSPTQLTAVIPAALIAQLGSAAIAAQNGSVSSNSLTFSANQPPLVLTGLSPNAALAGGTAFNLTVNGSGFLIGAGVTWNGISLTTTVASFTQLTAAVPANLIAAVAPVAVGVTGLKQASPPTLSFVISAKLAMTSLAPVSVTAGSPAFNLTVNGVGFATAAVVFWNTTALATTFANGGQVIASVPANFVGQQGSVSITVQSGGQVSNALPFTINTGLTLINVSPNPFPVNLNPTLSVTGTGFTASSLILWNGVQVLTTFVNSGQLTAVVPASRLGQPGSTVTITLQDGSAVSNALPLPMIVAPTLISLVPPSAVVGTKGITLTVNGSQFTSATQVTWNGVALPTTFVSTAQLTAGVGTQQLASAGNVIVSVSGQPQPASLVFSVNTPLIAGTPPPITTVIGRPLPVIPVVPGTPVVSPAVTPETPVLKPTTTTPKGRTK